MRVKLKTFDELVQLGLLPIPEIDPGWFVLYGKSAVAIAPEMIQDLGTTVEIKPNPHDPGYYSYKGKTGMWWMITDKFFASKSGWKIGYTCP